MYLLFAIICTKNCEYHSWVYFVNFLQTLECHSYLYTRQSNHFYPFLCMFILSKTNLNHAKLRTSNSMFSCTVVTFVVLNLSSASGKNAKFARFYQHKSVFTSPVCCNFSICKWSKYLLPPNTFCGKIRARMQRTNYIWNTDPSNLALTKSQIFNDAMVLYISRKKTLIIFLPKKCYLGKRHSGLKF